MFWLKNTGFGCYKHKQTQLEIILRSLSKTSSSSTLTNIETQSVHHHLVHLLILKSVHKTSNMNVISPLLLHFPPSNEKPNIPSINILNENLPSHVHNNSHLLPPSHGNQTLHLWVEGTTHIIMIGSRKIGSINKASSPARESICGSTTFNKWRCQRGVCHMSAEMRRRRNLGKCWKKKHLEWSIDLHRPLSQQALWGKSSGVTNNIIDGSVLFRCSRNQSSLKAVIYIIIYTCASPAVKKSLLIGSLRAFTTLLAKDDMVNTAYSDMWQH